MTIDNFIEKLAKKGVVLNNNQIRQFDIYYKTLIEWNEKINLTTIVNEEDVYIKHFYDSLSLGFYHQIDNQTICDVGAGAGFPSIPLKIVYPNIKVNIIEPITKRVVFLNHLIDSLDLKDTKVINTRAEDYIEGRENFDIVTARAVAKLSILSELCLPLVSLKGYFIALKGRNANEEISEASNAINVLGGKLKKNEFFELPNKENRNNIYIEKIKKTPSQYPRNYSKIKKTPL